MVSEGKDVGGMDKAYLFADSGKKLGGGYIGEVVGKSEVAVGTGAFGMYLLMVSA
jgi:hypothetical protein